MDSLLMFITILLWSHLGSPQSWKIRSSFLLQGGGEKNVEYESDDVNDLTGYESEDIINGKEFDDSQENEYEYESEETSLNSLRADDETSQTKKNEPTKVIDNIKYFTVDFYQKMRQFYVQMIENLQIIMDTIEEEEGISKGSYEGHDGNDTLLPKHENKGHRLGNVRGRSSTQKKGCRGFYRQGSCCTKESPCKAGGGDCDHDDDCKGKLICGRENCQDFRSAAMNYSDCCKRDRKSFHPKHKLFAYSFGDCDRDEDCGSRLVCGKDNCKDFHSDSKHTEWYKRVTERRKKLFGNPKHKMDCCLHPNCTFTRDGCVRRVSEGSGCKHDKQCKGILVCEENRCRESSQICEGLKGHSRCCTTKHPCEWGGGNCVYDDDCKGEMVCGQKNCQEWNKAAIGNYNCCEIKRKREMRRTAGFGRI